MAKKWLNSLADWLLIAGGLNWGLGLFDINLVSKIAGTGTLATVIYGAIGVSAVVKIYKMLVK